MPGYRAAASPMFSLLQTTHRRLIVARVRYVTERRCLRGIQRSMDVRQVPALLLVASPAFMIQ